MANMYVQYGMLEIKSIFTYITEFEKKSLLQMGKQNKIVPFLVVLVLI